MLWIVLAAFWIFCGTIATQIKWKIIGPPEGYHDWLCVIGYILLGVLALDSSLNNRKH